MGQITAYIDADIILHRAVSFVDDEFDGEEMNDWRLSLFFFNYILSNWLKEIEEKKIELKDYYLVFSVGQNFRKGLYDLYKANRKDIIPHPTFAKLKEECLEYDAAIWEEGIEADDLIGIRCSEDPQGTLAVSADKDFATVPCQLLIPGSHGKKASLHRFSEAEADVNWLRQCMTGDTIDNYKGIPGIGPKKAEAIVPQPAPLSYLWPKVETAFVNKGLSREHALLMARLARILRDGDYDFENKEVKLWNPVST